MKDLTIEPFKPEDLTNATDLMNNHKIDHEDAYHLDVATQIDAQEIISNNKTLTLQKQR